MFVFEPIEIEAARCSKANLYAQDSRIVVCAEFAQQLLEDLGDRDRASSALAFAVFHELGHVLLNQWRYPFYDNEEVADEFATVLIGDPRCVRQGTRPGRGLLGSVRVRGGTPRRSR